MHHEHGSVCMDNTTYQWIHECQTFVGSSVSSMRTFSVSEEPECEISGLHVWCVYADNTDVVQRRTSFCCFGSCCILGENSWRAQTSFCCHTWTRLDLHLCCFDVFYFSPQCQSPNDHCSVLHSSLGRCRTDILSHPELHTVSNLCLRLSLVRRQSQQPTLNLSVWGEGPSFGSEISHHAPAGAAQKCAAPGFRAASDILDQICTKMSNKQLIIVSLTTHSALPSNPRLCF